MTVNSIQATQNTKSQPSTKQKKVIKPYIKAEGAVSTTNNVKPLPPQGHLVKDDLASGTKFFFKDIAYDMKALKDGFQGNANDHQLGRLNDVGLKLGGIGIATYLASRTTNPKARWMEFIGLGAFLASMDLYPKIAINLPAKLRFGYDVHQEYIDDQGRKKSVMQDRNYIPYDMYNGRRADEDLAKIGDRFGIPRDIKNRDEVTKEQMSKTATQYNTLWMMTAGFATPVLTSLICYGLENYVVAPGLEKSRNKKFNKEIVDLLEKTEKMSTKIEDLKTNTLSKNVEKLLKQYQNEVLPEEEFESLIQILTKDFDNSLKESVRIDVANILKTSENKLNGVIYNPEQAEIFAQATKDALPKEHAELLEKYITLSKEEIDNVIKKFVTKQDNSKYESFAAEDILKIRLELRKHLEAKLKSSDCEVKEFADEFIDKIIDAIASKMEVTQIESSMFVTENSLNKLVNLAKILGEFKDYNKISAKCQNFKFEYAPETVLARYYNEFQNTFVKSLKITESEMEMIRESKDYAYKIIDERLSQIAEGSADEYEKIIKDFLKIITKMEKTLHGEKLEDDFILKLINATENNFNNTAKRLANLDIGAFKETIQNLVAEDPYTTSKSINTKNDLWMYLNGYKSEFMKWFNEGDYAERVKYAEELSKGVGSSKNLAISRIFDRYQGSVNSFYRIIHMFEVYKRATNPKEFAPILNRKTPKYIEDVINLGKEAVIKAGSAAHVLKLNTINAPEFYKDVMKSVWRHTYINNGIHDYGFVTDELKKAGMKLEQARINYQAYITRFREVIANSNVDFTKQGHTYDNLVKNELTRQSTSNSAVFNLVGQSPIDMLMKTSKSQYGTKKWFKIVSTVAAGIFGVTLLAQFGFGRLSNPQNLQKQVKDDSGN